MSVELDGANNVVKTDTVSEVTSANGVTIDGLSIKDSKLVTANSVIEANMSANSVDSDSYVDGSIDTAHIADLNVTEGKIAADAITAAKIADNAVVTAGINADAITAAKIADNAVVTAGINADAVTGAEIADDAINSEHYTDGSIDTAHLADGQVTIGKLATAVLTGATDIGAAIADADLLLVDDAAGGTLRKTTALRLFDYIGGKSKLFEGTFGSRTTGTISLSSMGFVPTAAHCIFAPNATTNATDEDNISIGFAVKTGATSSAHAVAYNYLQQSGTSAFDANPDVLGRLAFGSATFHNLTITAWNDDDCTLTKAVNGTPADVTLKYAIIVTG